ncbi:MAG: CAP domain-containing protein [Sphingomonadales bacterium]|nr:CAP domain-containing protein [Sphingomonadales bacterium]
MPDLPDLPRTETAIVAMTNAFRRENRLGPVTANKQLAAAAHWFAEYLARTGKFAHEADGRQPQQRAAAHGYAYCMVGENLAKNLDSRGFTTDRLATQAMQGWKASPPHRRTLLEPAVTEIGVAVAQIPDTHPSFVTVQLFGRPEALKIEFQIRNASAQAVSYTHAGETETIAPRTVATHTTCLPGELRFERGTLLSDTALDRRFPVENGARYTIETGADGKLSIRLEHRSGG